MLHKNYLYLVGKGSKYINVMYFFIIDKVEKKEVKIIYCPTEDIAADYSSKPM